jgi:CYTH domain-containing protein
MDDGIEIERKFLVARMPELDGAAREDVTQGYVTRPGDSAQVRLRRKGAAHLVTVKAGSGLRREERETEVTAEAFDALWPATRGRRIEKTRWTGTLPCGARFELDLFAGALAPLRLVEVEFADEDAARAFAPPDWFGREVTDDPAYANARLATEGAPEG